MQENNNNENNVVDPIKDRRDLGDKTIDAVENFMNTTNHIEEHNKEDIKKHKTNAMLCYIPFVVFYFIITGKYKESNYLHFHANQGIVLTLVYVFAAIVANILKIVFSRESLIINDTPMIIDFVCYVLYCVGFLLTLFGIINVSNDASKELPVVGKFKILK